MLLQERTVLITGATGALGRAVAAVVAGDTDARVALTSRSAGELRGVAEGLALPDERVLIETADLSDVDSVKRLVDTIAQRWGGVDVLFNTAGGWAGGARVGEMDVEAWEHMLNVNLRTAFLINRAVLPHMDERGWGRIVNVGSRSGIEPGLKQAQYNVSKAGVIMLTRSVARDYRRRGVTVNVVLPSTIDTASNRRQMPDADFGCWVQPEEIAHLMLYLASDEAASVNGAVIPIYGEA